MYNEQHKDKLYIVYMHISPSNKKYIGITSLEPKNRWRNGNGYKNNKHFTNAIKKYGWDNFQHIIIAKGLSEDEAKWLEVELIKKLDTSNKEKGYNVLLGGQGCIHTEETKNKISKANKGHKVPKEVRNKISKKRKGSRLSEETKRKIGDSIRGKKKSEDVKTKISQSHLGFRHTDETKKKMSKNHANFKGKNNPKAKSVICLTTKRIFFSVKEGADYYGCNYTNIVICCIGYKIQNGKKIKANSAGKYNGQKLIWKYLTWNHGRKYRINREVVV